VKITPDEARRRLSTARVARLATVSANAGEAARPHIVPITFAVDRDVIYTAVDVKPKTTRDLRRLRNLAVNPRVAVLADQYDEDWERLWWVRADGAAVVVSDRSAMAAPIELLARRYPQYLASPPPGPVIVISVGRWTGWSAS
jgi:PPOX class probable F420-dependent enzyme